MSTLKYFSCKNAFKIFSLDDIEDNAILRRGAPAAHLIYGLASTVYAIIYRMIILIEQLLDVSENKVL